MPKLPELNYKYWDNVNRFDQSEVTCLWAGFEPSQEALQNPRVLDIQRLLEEAWKNGILYPEIEEKKDINVKLDYRLWYWRQELIAYAEWALQKPAFLFPDIRIASEAILPCDSPSPLPTSNTSTADSKNAAVPVIAPSLPDENDESGLLKREKQIQAIECFAKELGYERLTIPPGGKAALRKKCMEIRMDIFGSGIDPFKEAWQEALNQNRIRTINHAKYSSR